MTGSSRAAKLALALTCAALALCAPARAAAARRPSVVLVVLDSVRADRVGRPGGPTPALDAYARTAAVFSNAYAGSNWTGGSFATMLTGRTPFEHGLLGLRDSLPPGLPTMQSVLSGAGYRTAAFPSGIADLFGFSRGFDLSSPAGNDALLRDRARDALAWVRSLPAGEDFFLLLHGNDAHRPYACPPGAPPPDALKDLGTDFFNYYNNAAPGPGEAGRTDPYKWRKVLALRGDAAFLGALAGSYDRCVAQLDGALGPLLAGLEGAGRPLLVIVTADHGEYLGEHGRLDHGWAFFDAVARVPLLLRFPGGVPRAESSLVSHLDLLPTVCAAARAACPPGLPGRDLAAPPGRAPARWASASGATINSRTEATNSAYLEGPLKLSMQGRRWRLADLVSDPGETGDLALSRPADFLRLAGAYLAFSGAAGVVPPRLDGGCFRPAAPPAPTGGAPSCGAAREEAYALARAGNAGAAAARLASAGCPPEAAAGDREALALIGEAMAAQRPELYADVAFRSGPGLWSASLSGYTVSFGAAGLSCAKDGGPAAEAGCVRPAAALLSCVEKFRFDGKAGRDPAAGRLGEALRRAGYIQ